MTALATRRPEPRSASAREQLWFDVPFTKAPAAPTGDLELSGYASTWGLDRDEEMVSPQAFDASLDDYLTKNPILLWQHCPDWPLGTVTSGRTDETGLYVTALIPNPGPDDADWQKGAYAAIKNGVVKTFSIGGYMTRDVKPGPAGPVFIISEVELFEISCVSIPANADSVYEAAVKALRGEPPRLGEKAAFQMEQLLGFVAISDPELAAMDEGRRRERYEELKSLFVRSHGVEPPGYDDWRRVAAAIEAGVSPLKTAMATSLVARAFYSPEPVAKAGRAISASNRQKLEAALDSHEELEGHMLKSVDAMRAAASAHDDAVKAIKDVLGVGDGEPDPDDDERDDEEPESPEGDKALESPDVKGALSAPSVPFAPRDAAWDAGAAEKRLRAWADAEDAPNAKLRRAYLWQDGDGSTFGQLKYPVCDVVGGELRCVFRAVSAAAARANQQGLDAIKPALETLYNRAKAQFDDPTIFPPWKSAPAAERKSLEDVGEEAIEMTEEDELLVSQAEYQRDLAEAALLYKQLALSAKGALPLASLPIAARDAPWDNGAAKGRVHAWAQGDPDAEQDSGRYDPAKLAKAYLWRDDGAAADQVSSYRFIVADLIDGQLTYVPRAIFAAANVVMGGRGGTQEEIANAIKPAIAKLYGRLADKFEDPGITPPWAR